MHLNEVDPIRHATQAEEHPWGNDYLDLINWLVVPLHSSQPNLYKEHLPPKIIFLGIGASKNCIDYALSGMIAPGEKVRGFVSPHLLVRSNGEMGDFVLFYDSQNAFPYPRYLHAAIYVGDGLFRSQWGGTNAGIFQHTAWLIPKCYGDSYHFFKMPIPS